MPHCALLPGAAQSACPGYRSTAVCHTVARTNAQHRLREIMPHRALLPGAAQSACPGYRSTAVCHTAARTDARHRLREIMPHCALLPGAAQAPARATDPLPSAIPQPGQMRGITSGKLCRTALCSRGRRKRLPGLQIHCRLPSGSPDRCAASPPGNYAALRSAPGGGASACSGYRSTAVCHTVARTDAQHRLREIMPHGALLPGAAQAPARATGPPPSANPSPGEGPQSALRGIFKAHQHQHRLLL